LVLIVKIPEHRHRNPCRVPVLLRI